MKRRVVYAVPEPARFEVDVLREELEAWKKIAEERRLALLVLEKRCQVSHQHKRA